MLTLKYLFIAEFTDGTDYQQTPQDVSYLNPKKSCFYDVLQSGKEIEKFSLIEGNNVYSVFLKDGFFEVNGKRFFAGEPLPIPSKLRLIFYRQHKHHFNRDSREELLHEIDYVIGWQTTIKGKNYQQIISVR